MNRYYRGVFCGWLMAGIFMYGQCPQELDMAEVVDVRGKVWSQVRLKSDPLLRQLLMVIAEGKGEARLTLSWDDVRQVKPVGQQWLHQQLLLSQELRDVQFIDCYRRLYRLWLPLLPLLREEQGRLLIPLMDMEIEEGRLRPALEVARALEPYVPAGILYERLENNILQLLYHLSEERELELRANQWVERRGWYAGNVMGHWIVADLAFRRGDGEGALWVALKAIVFCRASGADWLEYCYAVAIAAFLQLREEEQALLLLNEMTQRGYVWPGLSPEYRQASQWVESRMVTAEGGEQ